MTEPYAGIDAVEEQLQRAISEGGPSESQIEDAATVVLDAWDAALGVHWADGPRGRTVSGFPGLDVEAVAERIVDQWVRSPRPGRLREIVERYDLAYRTGRLDALLADAQSIATTLRDDVASLLGRAAGPPVRPWVTDLQAAIVALDTRHAPRAVRRRVREAVTFELGRLFREAAGGDWSVRSNPAYVDWGQFVVGTWSPSQVVDNVVVSSPPTMLVDVLEDEIAGFAEASPPVGVWLALCPPGRAVPLSSYASRTDYLEGTTPRMDGDRLVLHIVDPLTGRSTRVTVTQLAGDAVAEEARDLLATLPPELGVTWRGARERYEIAWDPEFTDEAYNPVLTFAEALVTDCGALIVDAATGTLPLH